MAYRKIVQQLGFIRSQLSPASVRVLIQGGLPYEAFDGAARVRPWSVLNAIDSARAFVWFRSSDEQHKSFIELDSLSNSFLPFIVSLKLDISREMYEYEIPKAPLLIDIKLENIGNSSVVLAHEVKHPDVKTPLAQCWIQNVFVSNQTRRPANLPDQWREKYKQLCASGKPLIIQKLDKPKDRGLIFCMDTEVLGSEIDPQLHANYVSYFRFCLNTLSSAQFRKQNGGVTSIPNQYVKSARLSYLNESLLGDQLSVEMWESASDSQTLNFEILKKESVLFQSGMELHDDL